MAHRLWVRARAGRGALNKFKRAARICGRVSVQRRVRPDGVVDVVDESRQARGDIVEGLVFCDIDRLDLRRFYEALGLRIVTGISSPAHGPDKEISLQGPPMTGRGVPGAPCPWAQYMTHRISGSLTDLFGMVVCHARRASSGGLACAPSPGSRSGVPTSRRV